MSRQIPTVRRKEIIYKRTYLNDHNEKIDQEFEKPLMLMRRAELENPLQYSSPPSYDPYVYRIPKSVQNISFQEQLRRVNTKLDDIIDHLRGNQKSEKNNEKKLPKETKTDEHLIKMKEICDRLEKIEQFTHTNFKQPPTNEEFSSLTQKVESLSNEQKDLKEKIEKMSTIGTESIDDLLTVVNDTRRDLEEKIANIKQLSDVNWINLDNKLDTFQGQQNGIQQQINDLMHILTSLTCSRPSSANDRHIMSRCSSKSSSIIRSPIVVPTSRSPAPRPPSSNSSKISNKKKSEKKKSYDSEKTIISNDNDAQKEPITKTPSIEVLRRDPGIETVPLQREKKGANSECSSAESYIAPLTINERRNSQPASVYYTKKNH